MSNDDPIKHDTIRLPPLKDVFPERAKKARQRLKLSQNDLAKMIADSGSPISGPAIGMWENGRGVPTADNLRRMAVLLGVSADYLLGIEHLLKRGVNRENKLAERFEKLTSIEQGVVDTLMESLERMRPVRQHKK